MPSLRLYSVHVELTRVRVDTVSCERKTEDTIEVIEQFNMILLVCDWNEVRGKV